MLMLEIFFWLCAFLIIIFGLIGVSGPEPYRVYGTRAFGILLFIMVLILGYMVFERGSIAVGPTVIERRVN